MTDEELKTQIRDIIHRELGLCNKDVVRDLMKLIRDFFDANVPVDISGKNEPYSAERHKTI